jgi:hypothetical protein
MNGSSLGKWLNLSLDGLFTYLEFTHQKLSWLWLSCVCVLSNPEILEHACMHDPHTKAIFDLTPDLLATWLQGKALLSFDCL